MVLPAAFSSAEITRAMLFRQILALVLVAAVFVVFDLGFYTLLTRRCVPNYSGANTSIRFEDYLPFDPDSRIARVESSLHLTENLPVLYLGGRHPLCDSIIDDYKYPYKEMIRHIIRDHRVSDCFYIAGLKDEDNSRLRLRLISWKNGEGLPGLSSVPTTVWLPRFAMICSAAVSACRRM